MVLMLQLCTKLWNPICATVKKKTAILYDAKS